MNAGENKRQYLSLIQGVIDRMGNNSFCLKGWAIAVMVALYALASPEKNKFAIGSLIIIVILWFLDAYYLQLEKKYRYLYNDARKKIEDEIDFDLNYNNSLIRMGEIKKYSYFNVLISKTILPFYITCILITVLVYFI